MHVHRRATKGLGVSSDWEEGRERDARDVFTHPLSVSQM